MNRFGRGNGSGGFAALLRRAGKGNINMDVNNKEKGAMPERGGSSGNRKPNDAATQRFMDAKNSAGKQAGGARISHGTRKAQKLGDAASHRIARGSPGTSGREIHHKSIVKRAGSVPSHISVGPHRSGMSSQKLSSTGRTRMSTEVGGRPGVPAHQSVINRGSKHSRSRTMNLASKLQY